MSRPTNESTESRAERTRAKRKEIRSGILCVVIAAAIALTLRMFVFEMVVVDGSSMNPTLTDKECVFAEKISRHFDGISYGDIVITHFPTGNDLYVKRVVAVEGDTIKAEGGILYLKHEGEKEFSAVTESFLGEPMWEEKDFSAIKIPDNCFFVMGDNRNHSSDSRYVGVIKEDLIRARVLFVVYPFGSMRYVADSAEAQ